MKKLTMTLTGIVVLLALVAAFIFLQLDSIVKAMIEKYGSAVMGVDVTVGKVKISPASGEGSVTRLVIDNPKGYKANQAFSMNSTSVSVDMKTVTSDVLVIDEIVMDGPSITYELSAKGSNFGVLRDNINNYMSQGKNKATGDDAASKQVIIKDLYIRNGKITVSAPMIQSQTFEVELPGIHLTDLGKNGGKGNLPQIMQQVMTIITNSVMSAVGPVTIQNFTNFLGGSAGAAGEAAGGILQGVTEGGEKGLEGIGGAIQDVMGGGSK